jgi:hypothetical protein
VTAADPGRVHARVAYLVACVETRMRMEDFGPAVAAMVGELRALDVLLGRELAPMLGPDLSDRLSIVLQAWKELR